MTNPDDLSLDPTDWDAMRALGHRMIDDVMEYLEDIRERPVWRPMPEATRDALRRGPPEGPAGAERAYEEVREHVLPYPYGNIHPRFWGWVNGQGTPLAVLADLLASTINPNVAFGETSGTYVEAQVLEWMRELLGFPDGTSGILVSGGSLANLTGLAVALDAKAPFDLATAGLAAAPKPMVLYASEEVHYSVDKAARLMGLGWSGVRKIPVDDEFRIDLAALARAVEADRAAGRHPFCVVGTAGTVSTGATDPLDALADFCRREDLWFHVDGAFGAMAALSSDDRDLVSGLERADSLAFDLHKWFYMPIDVGALLVRDAEAHRRAFSLSTDYLRGLPGGITRSGTAYRDYGLELTRRFRALKVWMAVKEHGIGTFRRLVAQNIEQAQYLAGLIDAAEDLELLAPVPLNVVCFRFVVPDMADEQLDALNERLLVELQESGIAAPSHTSVRGRFALRVAHTNHRTRHEDFDELITAVRRIGAGLGGRVAAMETPEGTR